MIKKFLVSVVLVNASFSVAQTIDYRREYLDGTEAHNNRVSVSHRFENNFGFALEAKWGNGRVPDNSAMFENFYSRGHELSVNYRHKFNDKITLTPSMSIDAGETNSTYKFNIKGQYQITKKLHTGLRYRYGVKVYDDSNKANNGRGDDHYHQANLSLGYKFNNASVEYDFEYKKTDYPSFKGKEHDSLHNLVVQVPIDKKITPYFEVGYVPFRDPIKDSRYAEDWQMRYRVGIKYHF